MECSKKGEGNYMLNSIPFIKELVGSLVETHSTRDPFIIAEENEINIIYLPSDFSFTKGSSITKSDEAVIMIKEGLSTAEQKFVTAHELGHVFLHRGLNFYFITEYTHFPISKFELEANIFAAELLISDDTLLSYKYEGYTFEQLSKILDIPLIAVKLKYALISGESIESYYS